MKTKVFEYKGYLGVSADLDKGKFINDLNDGGQLGMVVHIDEIEITKEAKEMIRNASREGGSFAPLMLTKHADGSGASFGFMGFGKVFYGKKIVIGRTCDKEILDDLPDTPFEAPQDFKDFVDNLKNKIN